MAQNQFTKIIQNVYDLDFVQLYRNRVKTPIVIRFSNFAQAVSDYITNPTTYTLNNPFCYYVYNNDVSTKIRSELNSKTTNGAMFTFDSNYNLVRDPLVVEDPFFIIDENGDIKLKNQ
ncbi:MAG: hypothetical protein Unbinned4388contig1000_79 [Prokaryotic dsDNA virus sp.]|nr:MAG: hypothetical protein Unbinned4388contig1000_79 [Prokaryotic dsDNA virus sp.]|tara:strand:+ start:7994 stop:8347 length:354 start_codon:yes stop_codon:yes gene_type:complete